MGSLERENAVLRGELTAVRDFFARDLGERRARGVVRRRGADAVPYVSPAEMSRRVAGVAEARASGAAADADARARIAALERLVAHDARAVEALQAQLEDGGGGGGGAGVVGIDPSAFAKQMRASLDAGDRAGALVAEVCAPRLCA